MAELARFIPVQLINPDNYRLLESGPKYRRQFVDWGVFHVKHDFFDVWRRFQRCLQQRNVALKQSPVSAKIWDQKFIHLSESLNQFRREYMNNLVPIVENLIKPVFSETVTIQYQCGWDENLGLEGCLIDGFERDSSQGFTYYGPQRGEIKMLVEDLPAVSVLSRGAAEGINCFDENCSRDTTKRLI